MGEQRLETNSCAVTLQLTNGEELTGEVFLQLVGARGIGIQRVGELLNTEDCFLPLRRDGRVSLINLRQVALVKVAADREADDLTRLGVQQQVSVSTTVGKSFQASIYINLPSHSGRVKDFLNQRQRFLPFFVDDQVIYLNFRFILQVED